MAACTRAPILSRNNPSEEAGMPLFWTIVTYAFVIGVLGLSGFAFLRIFGLGHWRGQH
jgi:hypothetical protein